MGRSSAILPEQFSSFGDLLKYLRRWAGLTQRELAAAVGYSDTQISRLEQNQRIPDEAVLAAQFVPALDLDPAWAARLLELAAEARRIEAAPPHPGALPAPHNLPLQLTSFIGRAKEMAEVSRLLALAQVHGAGARLVTLTGPGGTGKTRLALQVTAPLVASFPDGAWLVALASLSDPALVPHAVASVWGVREGQGYDILTALIDYLRAKQLLLLLDNCEHLLDACAHLVETLLQACPGLCILASSREPLGIAGETICRVPSLSLPDTRSAVSLETVAESEAARLFSERAAAVLPEFRLTAENAAAVAQICRRLDGIPLAIELAAAKVSVLEVEQIAARLSDRFRLLTGGSRTMLPRQQTLRATMDWSYDLLREDERVLFRRLSVFSGGWTLEAAEAVCEWAEIAAGEALDILIRLANKSLVVIERRPAAEGRYRLLETIRHYAQEKLFELGEGEESRRRHLAYFTSLAEQAEPELTGPDQVTWLNLLADELDNLRAALDWAAESSPTGGGEAGIAVEQGLRLGSATWRFCLRQGYLAEMAERLAQLLAHPAAAGRTQVRAKALTAVSNLSGWQDFARARAQAEESLAIYRELGDQGGEAASLFALGVAVWLQNDVAVGPPLIRASLALYRSLQDKQGLSEVLSYLGGFIEKDYFQARAYLEEALALCRERGDLIGIAGVLDGLGGLAVHQGDLAQARVWLEESLAIQRPLGAPGYGFTLFCLSELALREGDLAQARRLGEQSLAMCQSAGQTLSALWALAHLGYVELRAGDESAAGAALAEALRLFMKLGRKRGVFYTVEGLASLAARQGQVERAVRLFAWANAARELESDPRQPADQLDVERELAALRAGLAPAAFDAAWTGGRALAEESLEGVAAEALAGGAAA